MIQPTGPALKMVNTDYTLLPQNYPPLTGETVANWAVVKGGEAEPQEAGQLNWEGTGGGMLFTCLNEVNPGSHELGMTALMEVTAEEAHEIEIVVDIDDAGELEAKIISYTDPEHTEYDVLTSTEIPTSTGYLLQFNPTTDTVWLWIGRKAEHGFASGTKFKVTGTTTAKTTWTVYQMNIQGLLHSWRSPYRFAYNGQERVDDIKGKANHNTALYGEYDTRRAWRWNMDPKPVLGVSPYAMFNSNPIWFNDPLLDKFRNPHDKDYNKSKEALANAQGKYTEASKVYSSLVNTNSSSKDIKKASKAVAKAYRDLTDAQSEFDEINTKWTFSNNVLDNLKLKNPNWYKYWDNVKVGGKDVDIPVLSSFTSPRRPDGGFSPEAVEAGKNPVTGQYSIKVTLTTSSSFLKNTDAVRLKLISGASFNLAHGLGHVWLINNKYRSSHSDPKGEKNANTYGSTVIEGNNPHDENNIDYER